MDTKQDLPAAMNYDAVLSAALRLTEAERIRLCDDLASSVPEDESHQLSEVWLDEIDRRRPK